MIALSRDVSKMAGSVDAGFIAANRVDVIEYDGLYTQHLLGEMAQVKIVLDESGLTLIAPDRNTWEPDDMAVGFAQMPEAFARSYLQLRLRNFLYETFGGCHSLADSALASTAEASSPDVASPSISDAGISSPEAPLLINDRVSGGLHVGLLEQFKLSNQGKGYFDPGWQVVRVESDGAIAVQKHGIIVHVEQHHLSLDQPLKKQSVQPGELLAIKFQGYRFEPDVYIAIGDQGPVTDTEQALEIYFAASMAAMPLIMKTLTTSLNGKLCESELRESELRESELPESELLDSKRAIPSSIPYTLQVPYEPEGYEGPESIVLRIAKADFDQVLPLLQQIWEMCSQLKTSPQSPFKLLPQSETAQSETAQSETAQSEATNALLRPEVPLFSYPLWPGVAMADVIESSVTEWFGSSVELSRMHLVAEALMQVWYERLEELLNTQDVASQNLSAMQAMFSQAQLSWDRPFSSAL